MSSCNTRSCDDLQGSVEVEAAEVLASLGRGRGGGGDGDNCGWRSKGKRSNNNNKRLKEFESAVVVYSDRNPLPFDLNLDQAALFDEECEKDDQPSVVVKVEDNYAEGSCDGGCDALHTGGRSRQVVSEVEKEARRVRRILANRESARQTIRRRQALYEELKRRSTELAFENEDLKRTKNLAVQEFQSLEATNHNLKDKISQIAGLELGENHEAESASIPKWQQFLVNKFLPSNLILPDYVPPSEAETTRHSDHPGPFDSHFAPEMVFSSHVISCRSNEQDDSIHQGTTQQLPWCILPFPCFLSVPDSVKGAHQLGSSKTMEKDPARHVCSPSSVIPRPRDCQTYSNPRVAFHTDSAFPCSLSTPRKMETCVFDRNQKKNDVVTACAEARKRRREVIKLKSLHYDSVLRRRNG